MMSPLHSGAATLPKGFRYECDNPRTPEPSAPGEESLPSPPRPRLRLKRRNVSSQLHAPTQQFLASVAAADVPIPSVEEPEFADAEMMDSLPEIRLQEYESLDVYEHIHARTFSPPKTPALDITPSLPTTNHPNWSSIDSSWSSSDMESSPEYESSRPSTAFSTQTSSSLFSQYSHPSEDGDCVSPEVDSGDFSMSDLQKRKPRKAPWTKAMSSHLWSTYLLYLQDPRVTPFRLGNSAVPPEGVCSRVAREAKRSWKGSHAPAMSRVPNTGTRSGSSTPTAESSKPYIQWPHTCAATRAHLRELCRLDARSKQGRLHISQSPTPFNKAAHRRWNRRSTPARSPSIFSSQDMAMSLTLSTSEAMQPQGPLAQLTSSHYDPFMEPLSMTSPDLGTATSDDSLVLDRDRTRLGSPFLARSYGPSSSSSLAASINMRRQSQTLGPRKLLKSPVRLAHPRSGTQKRRSVKGLEDQPRKRPSLAAALWGSPTESSQPNEKPEESEAQFSSTNTAQGHEHFILRSATRPSSISNDGQLQDANPIVAADSSASSTASKPARLGSPFSGSNLSHSFPHRLSQPPSFNLSAFGRRFATVQQTTESSSEMAPARSSLASRLAYIDQRLKEFRSRSSARRRSQSPF